MSTSSSERDPVERLAEEFAERLRRGETPSLTEYTRLHPDRADEIRELFPALAAMEQLKPRPGDLTGDFDGAVEDAPRQLGEYRLLREVGRGGMGVVYEAEQVSLGRRVALKVLPPQARLNPTYLERFRREAKAAAHLHHTNIVPVFGVGESDGTPFYAMQFIAGEGLDKVLADLRRLRGAGEAEPGGAASALLSGLSLPTVTDLANAPPANAPPRFPQPASSGLSVSGPEGEFFRGVARLGLQVAEALAYAHRQGVLHRDIKPSNLLLDAQGIVWITDFGLAKAEGTDELTHTGDIVGTVRFVAPERFDGRSLPQSDVYALGLTLYELMTLKPAFADANKGRLIEKVLHEPPPPPRKLDPRVPRDLETVVLKCLAKDPAERYARADDLADDLRRFLADRPVRARRASGAEKAWRWCRRNPALASLLAAVASLLVVVAAGSTFAAARLNVALGRKTEAERVARLREAESYYALAHGTRLSRRPGQRIQTLEAMRKSAEIGRELGQEPAWFDRLRNEAIAALALCDVHVTESWDGYPPGTADADVSDDLELYVRVSNRGGVSVRRVSDDAEVAALPELRERTGAYFGPGRRLFVHGSDTLRGQLWDLAGPEPALRLERPGLTGFDFSRDGKLFVAARSNGAVEAYDVANGRLVHALKPGRVVRRATPCLHPSELVVLVYSYLHHTAELRDLRTGQLLAVVDPPWQGGVGGPAWSPDGRTLAVPGGDVNEIQFFSFDPAGPTLRPTRVLDKVGATGGLVAAFHPAGDRLVCRNWSNVVTLIDVPANRVLYSTPPQAFARTSGFRLDPSGGRVGPARAGEHNDRLGLWSIADGREYRVFTTARRGEVTDGRQPAVHPNCRLAAQSYTKGVVLLDLETGQEAAFLPIPDASPYHWASSVCFDGAGNLLTNTYSGFLRWPVRADPVKPGGWVVGPPEPLPFHRGIHSIAASRDGRVVAQAMWHGYGMSQHAGGWVLHPNSPRPRWVFRGDTASHPSVSPDGRWVTFSEKVYESATGKLAWRGSEHGVCLFSPDGRLMVTSTEGGRVHAVGSWEPGARVGPGHPWAVSPDSAFVVMGMNNGTYRLVELATGRELARLEDPDQTNGAATLTPDGTRLLVTGKDNVRVWDLRRLRQGLAELGLDWDAPPLPAAPPGKPAPIEVRLIGPELADPKKMAAHLNRKAVADLLANPFDAHAYHRLGEFLSTNRAPLPAYAALSVALALRPDRHETYYHRARAAFLLRRWHWVAADATRFLRREPDDVPALYLRGQANRLGGRYDEAARDYTTLLANFPQDQRLYESRAECHEKAGRADLARADREKAFQLDAIDPQGMNNQAWLLVTGPPNRRDPARALRLVQAALKLEPGNATYLNTLGVAQYRNGLFAQAVVTLEQSLAAGKGEHDAFDLFFLAMCHAKLGDAPRAKDCFDRAVRWVESQKDLPAQHAEELKAFRAEAEATLAGK